MTLVEFVNVLLVKQRRVFLTVLLVAFGVAVAVTFLLPKQYEATAKLFVGENRPALEGAQSVPLDEVLAASYRDLLGTVDMQRQAARRLDVRPDELAGKVEFRIATGTRLIEIVATDSAPRRAAKIANAYARTFVAKRQQLADRDEAQRLQSERRKIDELTREIGALSDSTSPSDIARRLQAESELEVARDTTKAITQNEALAGQNVSLASRAFPPDSPARPQPKLYLTLGAVLALLLAIGGAFVANAFDTRIRDSAELTEMFGAPVLGIIPRAREFDLGKNPQLRGSFEFLRLNLRLVDGTGDPTRVIAVTGALPGSGKTVVTAGLARTLARFGAAVIAVDADLRRPALADGLSLKNDAGLTQVLSDSGDPLRLLKSVEGGARILPAGPVPPEPALYLTQERIASVVSKLEPHAEYVIMDTPPVLSAPETSAVIAAVDEVVLVIDMQNARRRALQATQAQLATAEARVVGLILNRVSERSADYDYSYYGSYGYRDDADRDGPTRSGAQQPGAGAGTV
jgi:capsular exopolysaccharide synthesis family protein